MSNKKNRLLFFLVTIFLFLVMLEPVCFAVSADEAGLALDQAERDLNLAFNAVAAAGDAGADVAGLLERLSTAGDYLSEARAAYRVGDYETAYADSVACGNSLTGVADETMQLRLSAESARNETLLFDVVGSSVGLVLLFVLGFLGWRYLRRWYLKGVMDMKPVVEDQQ